ncbi:MAG: transposase, partial [Candidatus Heimdallarchaeota archaeon]
MRIESPTKQYKSDNHLVYSCQYHVIFCPKYRRPVLKERIAERLKELILEKQKEYEYEILD